MAAGCWTSIFLKMAFPSLVRTIWHGIPMKFSKYFKIFYPKYEQINKKSKISTQNSFLSQILYPNSIEFFKISSKIWQFFLKFPKKFNLVNFIIIILQFIKNEIYFSFGWRRIYDRRERLWIYFFWIFRKNYFFQ